MIMVNKHRLRPGAFRVNVGVRMSKALFCVAILCASALASAQCVPYGWVKVVDKLLSVSERACVYEKSGVRVQIIVSGFCPLNPC